MTILGLSRIFFNFDSRVLNETRETNHDIPAWIILELSAVYAHPKCNNSFAEAIKCIFEKMTQTQDQTIVKSLEVINDTVLQNKQYWLDKYDEYNVIKGVEKTLKAYFY
jgi:hypothetical protein